MTQNADGLAKLDTTAIPEGGSVDPSRFLPGDVTVAWVFRVSQKLMANDIYLTIERLGVNNDADLIFRSGGASKWAVGLRSLGDNRLRLYSYGLNTDVFEIDDATGQTFLRGVLRLEKENPVIDFYETTGAPNSKRWRHIADPTTYSLRTTEDTSSVGQEIFGATRSGTAITAIRLGAIPTVGGVPMVTVRHGSATSVPADLAENQVYFGY